MQRRHAEAVRDVDSGAGGSPADPFYYLEVLWKRKVMVVVGTILCALATYGVTLLLPPRYEAAMIIEIGTGVSDSFMPTVLENPGGICSIIASDEIVAEMRQTLGPAGRTFARKNLTCRRIGGPSALSKDSDTSPLFEVRLQLGDPQATIAGLNFLVNRLAQDHEGPYQRGLASLDGAIRVTQRQVQTNIEYSDNLKGRIAAFEEDLRVAKKKIAADQSSQADPTKTMFLQSGLLRDQEYLGTLYQELAKLRSETQDREKELLRLQGLTRSLAVPVGSSQSSALGQKSFLSLSRNTHIRTKPVMPESPVFPRTRLFTIAGGFVGLVAFVLLALLLEALAGREQVQAASRRGTPLMMSKEE